MISKIFNSLTSLEKKILIAAVIVFLSAFALRASFYYMDNTKVVASQGGEYREGIIGQPVFINPVLPTTEADRDISHLIFDNLKDIAESIRRSEDGTMWNIRIFDDLRWHDGERVTTDDIIFTLETIQNRDARSILYTSFQGVSAKRVSALEIEFTLQAPYAFFEEEHLTNLYIIPKHIFEDIPVQNFRLSTYGLNPIGFGPYQSDGFVKDDRGVIQFFSLKAYKTGLVKSNIDRITFKFFKDEEDLISAYNAGKIDGFGLSSHEILSGEEAKKISARHELYSLKSSRYYAIFINQTLGDRKLKDGDVREALSMSVSREEVINKIFGGYATPLYGPTFLTTETSGSYDPELLQDLKLNITLPDEPFLLKTAELLKTEWESLGATVTLTPLSLKTIQEKVLKNTDYEMLMFGNITGASNDLFSFWHSSRRFYPDQNLSLYQNNGTDDLLEAFRKDFDTSTRSIRLAEISDRIAANYPAIFLYSPDYIYVSAPNLRGFSNTKIMNTSSDRFSDINNWYVKTDRVWK